MSAKELEAREKILAAAIELIEEHGDTAKITIRDIAAKAEVGVGLVNYHFQTKENLVNQCVQILISQVIDKFQPLYQSLNMSPQDKLRFLLKSTASFLAAKPGISRISILADIISGHSGDNSSQTARAYFPVLKEVFGDSKTDLELKIVLHMLISSVQIAFMRHDTISKTIEKDFFDAHQREEFIDMLIDCIIKQ